MGRVGFADVSRGRRKGCRGVGVILSCQSRSPEGRTRFALMTTPRVEFQVLGPFCVSHGILDRATHQSATRGRMLRGA